MTKRRIFDDDLHAQFVTFSCHRRRRLLDDARAREMVVAMLASQLAMQDGICSGFVVMPDHVHAIVWFPQTGRLSHFMKQWKQRSSVKLKKFVRGQLWRYASHFDRKEPFWQASYYPFNLYSEKKAREKLDYMHLNPVRAGLVERACDWAWSSARYYEEGKPVGVPVEWIF
ncbi:MAG TPA: transposase [Thermoguttaceae bacterium]|nr:transposase [Thermoguttaceae bacterium]